MIVLRPLCTQPGTALRPPSLGLPGTLCTQYTRYCLFLLKTQLAIKQLISGAGPPRRPKLLACSRVTFSSLKNSLLFDRPFGPHFSDFDPILDPKLAPISPSFALLFPITFPTRFPTSFWTDFGPQIDVKIDQKSIKKFFQNQPTNQSYFSFIFNQISKTISCSSKMVDFRKSFQNLVFL